MPHVKINEFMETLKKRNPGEVEFHQAVYEVMQHIIPYVNENPKFQKTNILERIVEPDRIISFRVTWEDDNGDIHVNKGYRVQFNNAIGPYKGGLRFHPSVNQSILKFLGFEQIFKNSLTTLPMGGAKGGSDFDPKGKSDREVMRFCQSFMSELAKHIGKNMDVPAGDIGVGAREISFMFGQFKRLRNEFEGAMTGKALEFGGSQIRKEATGYGAVFFMDEMLKRHKMEIKNKNCAISGSGNVAQYAAEKLLQLGANVITMSDSSGYFFAENGINKDQLDEIIILKNETRGRLKDFAEKYNYPYFESKRPWEQKCDLAFPCATQNELEIVDAKNLVKNGCLAVAEGANMPTTPEAVEYLQKNKVLYAPGKASNAGGVAVSGLEMTQNSLRLSWTHEDLEQRLHKIMKDIHEQCCKYGDSDGQVDYVKGANLAGFVKVAHAMLAYGVM